MMRNNRSRLLFVIGSIAALVSIRAVTNPAGSGRDPATRALTIFSDVLNLTRQNYVVAPLPGSPADKAGVKPGDLIDMIDGKQVRNFSLWRVKASLEGPEGTHVDLVLFRGGDEKRVQLKVERAKIAPAPLTTRWERDVAIVRIPSFSR